MADRVQWEYTARKVEGDLLSAFTSWGRDGWEVLFPIQTTEHGLVYVAKRVAPVIATPTGEEVRTLAVVR